MRKMSTKSNDKTTEHLFKNNTKLLFFSLLEVYLLIYLKVNIIKNLCLNVVYSVY